MAVIPVTLVLCAVSILLTQMAIYTYRTLIRAQSLLWPIVIGCLLAQLFALVQAGVNIPLQHRASLGTSLTFGCNCQSGVWIKGGQGTGRVCIQCLGRLGWGAAQCSTKGAWSGITYPQLNDGDLDTGEIGCRTYFD